jgi:beta-galactosidase
VAWAYRPVTVTAAGRSRLRVTNRQAFVGLGDLAAEWELLVDGDVVERGALDVPDVAPLDSTTIALPCAVPTASDARLTVRFRARRSTPWAPAGHLVAWDEVELRRPPARRRPTAVSTGPVAGLGASPVELSLFRAPTDNDGFKLLPDLSRRLKVGGTALVGWQDAGLDRRPSADVLADLGGSHRHDVEALDDGSEVHTHRIVVPDALADLGRVGVTFRLPAGYDRVRWFGRGPLENYPDRNRGALVGVWERPVDEPPYLVPQEFGMRTDCRWFELVDSTSGTALRVEALHPSTLHCSATRFTASDLYEAAHETDLRPRRGLVVHVDVAHRGVGTASCGPDTLPAHRIPPGPHTLTYRLLRTN